MVLIALLYTVFQLFLLNRIIGSKIVNKGVKVLFVTILTGCQLDIYRHYLF